MVVRFVAPGRHRDALPDDFLPAVPPELLDRHGARVLRPIDGPVVDGWPTARSSRYQPTIYRPGILIVDAADWNTPAIREAIIGALGGEGLRGIAPDRGELAASAPVPLALVPLLPNRAVTVDAWAVLQHLRAATSPTVIEGRRPGLFRRRPPARASALTRAVVDRMSLDYLMVVADGGIHGVPWDISSLGTRITGGAPRSRSRIPVSLPAGAPPRHEPCGRRVCVAVVDSGVGPHPWLDVHDPAGGQAFADEFVTIAPDIQAEILRQQKNAEQHTPTELLPDHRDGPMTTEPLIGEVAPDTGHGTFIMGIIRQHAPDARVLSVRVVHTSGVAYIADSLLVLKLLLDRVRRAQDENNPELMIDILSLSIGYYDVAPITPDYHSSVAAIIDELTCRGVVVLSAAGNDATTKPFYPAALCGRPAAPAAGPQLIGVGALNPDGTEALFSNAGPSVSCWADGVSVVSTYPVTVDGSEPPDHVVQGGRRAGFDPDNFVSGFGIGDGTSYATPLAAAEVANALMAVPGRLGRHLGLEDISRERTVERANAALAALR